MVVSRWFVMPTAAILAPSSLLDAPRGPTARRRPDLLGVVLDPAGLGIVLPELGHSRAPALASASTTSAVDPVVP